MINALVDYLANLFKNEHGIDLRDDPDVKERLHNASEMAAIALVNNLETTINLPYIWVDSSGPKHFEHNLTRAELQNLPGDKAELSISGKQKAEHYIGLDEFDKAIEIYILLGEMEEVTKTRKLKIRRREELLDYDSAIHMWEELGENEEAARVRKLKADLAAPKTEIHGDYIDDRDTIVKDSVINRSNVGAGGKSKAEEIKEIKELLDSGAIDKDDYEKMKREIIG